MAKSRYSSFMGGNVTGMYCGGDVAAIYQGDVLIWDSTGNSNGHVKFGEHYYPFTTIGDQQWTTRNFKEVIGTLGNTCYWYDNDPSYDEAHFGLLYPWSTVCSANETMSDGLAALMHDGWHLPTKGDWFRLCDYCGVIDGTSKTGHEKLRSTSGWLLTQGTDIYGFNAMPCGRMDNNSFTAKGSLSMMWLSTEASTTSANDIVLQGNGQFVREYSNLKTSCYSVRLVKNLT